MPFGRHQEVNALLRFHTDYEALSKQYDKNFYRRKKTQNILSGIETIGGNVPSELENNPTAQSAYEIYFRDGRFFFLAESWLCGPKQLQFCAVLSLVITQEVNRPPK